MPLCKCNNAKTLCLHETDYGDGGARTGLPALVGENQSGLRPFCRSSAGRSLSREIDASYAGTLKVSTVTASGVNLFRTRNEIKRSNDDWFYTVFQLSGGRPSSRTIAVVLDAGDITLIDASRPCSIFWQQTSRGPPCYCPDSCWSNSCAAVK